MDNIWKECEYLQGKASAILARNLLISFEYYLFDNYALVMQSRRFTIQKTINVDGQAWFRLKHGRIQSYIFKLSETESALYFPMTSLYIDGSTIAYKMDAKISQ